MMKITQLLTENTIILDLQAASKEEVLNEQISKLDQAGKLQDKQAFTRDILAREEQSTTGIGDGIAIPHAKSSAVKAPAIAFGRSLSGLDYKSLDGQPAHLFFMIAASEGANNDHLDALSRLATFLMDSKFREKILEATSIEEVLSAITDKETEVDGPEAVLKTEQAHDDVNSSKRILAVTACPTGIAHTYMAAEKLKERAKELGISLKVETNGSSGVKNRLTDADIVEADAIIVAADTKVEMSRFNGKHVIQVKVGKAIYETDSLLNRAVTNDAPIYQHDSSN